MVAEFLAYLVLIVMVEITGFALQESERKPSGHSFSFRRGQPVYIAALRRNLGSGHEITDLSFGFAHGLDIEKQVRNDSRIQGRVGNTKGEVGSVTTRKQVCFFLPKE